MKKMSDIKSNITRWLSEQGYPLEMRVAQSLSQAGLGVVQSDYYADFETGKNREIDVTCRAYDYYEPKMTPSITELEIFSLIECKSNEKPWVVFKGAKIPRWNLESPLCNSEGQRLLQKIGNKIEKSFFNEIATSAAHGVTQAFTNGKDIPYEAIMTALKAAEAKIRIELKAETEKSELLEHGIEEHKLPVCIFPAVIIDAQLFECELTKSGTTRLNEIEYGAVVVRYPRREQRFRKSAVVFIFRESALKKFVAGFEEFRSILKASLPHLLKGSTV